MNKILVTGGAGFIGSHTVKELKKAGYDVFVIDNLSTGNKKNVAEDELKVCDISDYDEVKKVIREFKPAAVIHFAASKDAAESVQNPKKYFENNVGGTISLLSNLLEENVKNFIFSSTAAVYGDVKEAPITEEFETKPTNPYGLTKLMVEHILKEYEKVYDFKPTILRYFNAGGADPEGELGNLYPDPKDVISRLILTAKGEANLFQIFGTDYDTRDGSCIRDIIHVSDLAKAHVKALEKLLNEGKGGTYNLGSEKGFTVKEIVDSTKKITGIDFSVKESPRREGDIVVSIASSKKAKEELGWTNIYGIDDIIKTAWEWEKRNKKD